MDVILLVYCPRDIFNFGVTSDSIVAMHPWRLYEIPGQWRWWSCSNKEGLHIAWPLFVFLLKKLIVLLKTFSPLFCHYISTLALSACCEFLFHKETTVTMMKTGKSIESLHIFLIVTIGKFTEVYTKGIFKI